MEHDPDAHDLVKQFIRLEGEVRTSVSENAAMESRIDARLAGMEADMARHREDMAKRDAEAVRVLAGMEADMAKRDAEAARVLVGMEASMAKRDAEAASIAAQRFTDAAKRDKDNMRWYIGLWVAAVVIIGILVRWPAS